MKEEKRVEMDWGKLDGTSKGKKCKAKKCKGKKLSRKRGSLNDPGYSNILS